MLVWGLADRVEKFFLLRFELQQTVLSGVFWASNTQECLKRRFLCLWAWGRGGVGARLDCVLLLFPWSESEEVFYHWVT